MVELSKLSKGIKRYSSNTIWLLLEKAIRIIIGITLFSWVIRYLGPKNFGTLSYAQSFVDLFTPISLLGIDGILIRELIKHSDLKDSLLGSAFILRIIGALASCIIIAIGIYFSNNTYEQNILIIILSFTLFLKSLWILRPYFARAVLYKYTVYSNLIALFSCSLIRIFLIVNEFPTVYFALSFLLDCIISTSFYIYFYLYLEKRSLFSWKPNYKIMKTILLYSWPYLFTGLMGSIYVQIDQVMLNYMLDSSTVGYYAAASRVCSPCFTVPLLVVSSLLPAIINAKKRSDEEFLFRVQRLYDLVIFICLCISIPIIIYSEEIIHILYGDKFFISGKILSINIFCIFLLSIGSVRGSWTLNQNLQKYDLYFYSIGAVFNVVFNIIFIKVYGIFGASYGTLLAQIVTFLFTALVFHKIRRSFFMALKGFFNIFTLQFLKKGYLSW